MLGRTRSRSRLQARGSKTPAGTCSQADVFELIYTSGTTARPKAVMLCHANAQSLTILNALTAGATVVLVEEYRASRFWEQVRSHEAIVLSVVAMQLRTLLAQHERPTHGDHHVRRTFYAINVSDQEKEDFERRYGVELLNGYGLSEALTIAPVAGPGRWPSIGLPAFDREVRIVDEDGATARPHRCARSSSAAFPAEP